MNTANTHKEFTNKDKEYINNAIGRMSANLSKYVKELKQRANISSREMSRRTGVSIAVISDIEGNKYLPKMEVILKIAYGMNVNFLQMLDNLWDNNDALEWSKLTNTPVSSYMLDRKAKGNDNTLSLDDMLAKEGLTKNNVKEVLEFITFKKAKQKRR